MADKSPDNAVSETPSADEAAWTGPTRRTFLKGIGRKALFTTPAVVTLTATPALAASGVSGASCLPLGVECTDASECCDATAGCDDDMGMEAFKVCCIEQAMSGCSSNSDCCWSSDACFLGSCSRPMGGE